MRPRSSVAVTTAGRVIASNGVTVQADDGPPRTLLAFSDIFVDNSMEDGMQSDVNDFALALYQYLKGLNLSVSRTITGNSIDVIIY